jgi:riboflavin synthase
MFTGIIETTGKLIKINNKNNKIYFTIAVHSVKFPQGWGEKQFNRVNFLKEVKVGDSVSCDGACLTVIKKTRNSFKVELMPETLRRTKFRKAKAGDLINLELALKMGERIDGHFVMGHIDGVGVVKNIIYELETAATRQSSPPRRGDSAGTHESGFRDLIIKVPRKLMKYLAYKGSVAVNGVSLTVSGVGKDWFMVSLITHTLENTNLVELKRGDEVNIEVDMIARYIESLKCKNKKSTYNEK